ncbi:pheromone A receptor-domain-containing protein [Mycena metata]|uniref:Pheromone A receptor-domain-containing protein n=1 Tax=Mycena metata TaxID=1033252 RepID=A0AAD7MSJ4_9AGAR|nr:pheromone A receptor-domain-containing protein [Mycena metata]
MWFALAYLNQFVNSVLWANDSINHAPVWCDISASVCINRRLYEIARAKPDTISVAHLFYVSITFQPTVFRTGAQYSVLSDSLICVLFPLVYITLSKTHHFDIYEQVGCFPILSNLYFLSMIWSPLVFAVYSIHALRASRATFNEFLDPTTTILPELTVSRYLRPMVLTGMAILVITPPQHPRPLAHPHRHTSHSLAFPLRDAPELHLDFSRVDEIPVSVWLANKPLAVHYTPLATVLAAVLWRLAARLGFHLPVSGVLAAPFVTNGSSDQASSTTLGGRFGPGIGYTKPFEKDARFATSRVPTSRFSAYSAASVSVSYSGDSHVDVSAPTPLANVAVRLCTRPHPPPSSPCRSPRRRPPSAPPRPPLRIGWQAHGDAYPCPTAPSKFYLVWGGGTKRTVVVARVRPALVRHGGGGRAAPGYGGAGPGVGLSLRHIYNARRLFDLFCTHT